MLCLMSVRLWACGFDLLRVSIVRTDRRDHVGLCLGLVCGFRRLFVLDVVNAIHLFDVMFVVACHWANQNIRRLRLPYLDQNTCSKC